MLAQQRDEIGVAAALSPGPQRATGGRGLRLGQLAFVGVDVEHPLGVLLGLGDVGLVEGVDAQADAGDRGGELPAEELGRHPGGVVEADVDERMAGPGQGAQLGVDVDVPLAVAGRTQADEDAIVAVDLRCTQGLAIDGHDAHPILAGGLGDELLQPRSQRREVGLDDEGQLVATGLGQGSHGRAQHQRRVVVGVGLRGVGHDACVLEQRIEVEPEQRRGHQAHIGQGAVAASDIGGVEEGLAEVVGVRDGRQRLARIGDGDELVAGLAVREAPDAVLLFLPVVGEEGQRLGRGARLGGDDAQGAPGVEGPVVGGDRLRVRRVEDVDPQTLLRLGVDPGQHLRRERGAAHAADEHVGVALPCDLLAEGGQLGDLVLEEGGREQPAETVLDLGRDLGIVGPEAGVTGPQAAGPAPSDGRGDGLVDGGLQLCGERE